MTAFLRVMLPLALPSVGTPAIFCHQGTWEEFFSAKVIPGGVQKNIALPVMIRSLKGARHAPGTDLFGLHSRADPHDSAVFRVPETLRRIRRGGRFRQGLTGRRAGAARPAPSEKKPSRGLLHPRHGGRARRYSILRGQVVPRHTSVGDVI